MFEICSLSDKQTSWFVISGSSSCCRRGCVTFVTLSVSPHIPGSTNSDGPMFDYICLERNRFDLVSGRTGPELHADDRSTRFYGSLHYGVQW